jgi:acyl-coenzyme A thioesterase PaaI-like protein
VCAGGDERGSAGPADPDGQRTPEPKGSRDKVSGVSAANTPPRPGRRGLAPPPDAAAPVRHPDAPAPGELLGAHYDQCFGCGESQPHGLHLAARAGEGVSVTAEFTVQAAHQGAPGLAHGGVLASALDETLGSLSWLLRVIAVTGRLESDFLRPVPVGSTLYLSAHCDGVDGRKIYSSAEGRIGGPDGPVAVRADALFVEVKVEHFTRNGRSDEIEAAMADPDQVKVARAFEVNP